MVSMAVVIPTTAIFCKIQGKILRVHSGGIAKEMKMHTAYGLSVKIYERKRLRESWSLANTEPCFNEILAFVRKLPLIRPGNRKKQREPPKRGSSLCVVRMTGFDVSGIFGFAAGLRCPIKSADLR